MCTVTYVPLGNKNFIFTSNRDESPMRGAQEVIEEKLFNKELLFPRDVKAKGTWISVSNTNQLICILNGAFEKHKRKPSYRMSRGIMALDFFKYKNAEEFFEKFQFEGMEAFTMIIFDDEKLYEFRWDESKKHIKNLDVKINHIWSSCTLYTEEWQSKRRSWFKEWSGNTKDIHQTSILDFHKNGGEGNLSYDNVMNRDGIIQTVSITSIIKERESFAMRYEDLLRNEVVVKELKQTTR